MSRNDRGYSTAIIFLMVGVALAILLGVFVLHRHAAATRKTAAGEVRPLPSAGQQAYFPSLVFADLRMSAAANFLGDTVTYLDGTVTNKGSKAVRRVDVELNFVDTLNQVVLRETAHPLANRTGPLGSGESYAFRVTFDHLPVDWNQAPPSVKVVYVEF
jgi:hypothetical protein